MTGTKKTARLVVLLGLLVLPFSECIAAKKDFRGLFGSYRRERYVENEARDTDFGIDLMLSTLLPINPLFSSIESQGGTSVPLKDSAFFNFEFSAFLSLGYHWEVFGTVGYYTYDTRKENTIWTDADGPLFHQAEMTMFPILGGLRYRFGTEDIVPYVGAGLGMAVTRRRAYYDYGNPEDPQSFNAVVAQFLAGVEFYISSRTGIRLEMSAYFMNLPGGEFQPGVIVTQFPTMQYRANPWSVRYSSGLFILF